MLRKRAIQRQRRSGERLRHALRQHHLHDVAVEDVLLGFLHRRLERGFAEFRFCLVAAQLRRIGDLHRLAQRALQIIQPLQCGAVGVGMRRVGIHDEGQLAGEVVDHRQLLGEHQQDVGRAEGVFLFGFGQARLDIAHRVVAEVTGQAAGEARQAGQRRDLEAGLILADEIQRIVRFLGGFAGGSGQRDLLAAHRDARLGRQADEGITPEAFAALHRFQQVGERFVGELEIERQRRVEVGEGLRDQRDAVVALAGKGLEFLFSDGGQHKNLRCCVGRVSTRLSFVSG